MAEGQWGCVTERQAERAGVSVVELGRFKEAGVVEPVIEGVMRIRAGGRHLFPRLYSQWLMLDPERPGWLRDAPGCGVVSHATALRVYGIGDRPGLGVEFTLPAGPARPRSSHPGIVLHSGEVAADEWTTRSDLFVTTPARTLRDLTYSGRFDLAELGRVAHAFLRTHLANETELARGLEVTARTSPYSGETAGSLESILRAADEDSVDFPVHPQR
ncbi:hypothetical protein Manayef4_09050 [Frankia sp. CgMI4]|nr:hypothetical protein Manayef4_09050 [Frankia sp. CgIM4]